MATQSAVKQVRTGIENGFTVVLSDGRSIAVRAWLPEFGGMPTLIVSEKPPYEAAWDIIETKSLEDLTEKMNDFAPIDQWSAIHQPPAPLMSDHDIVVLNDLISAAVEAAAKMLKEAKNV